MIESSLLRNLTLRVTAAILTLLILDAVACYYTAAHFANLVYDRWLVDSARSLSKAIRVQGDRVTFDLPHVALDVFQFDEVDKTYFRIASSKQGFISGEPTLPELRVTGDDLQLADTSMENLPVRAVATNVPIASLHDVVTVEVAETLNKRAKLASEIVLAMAAPQVGLLIAALGLGWLGVSRGLKPLTNLAAQIEARGHDNLAPVPNHGLPKEARTLASKINDLLVRLAQAMHAQKRFVADAAHQLRTPLAAILLYVERAERATDEAEEKNALKGLHAAAERAARLSQQLLTLARAEPEATSSVEFRPVDLTMLARAVGEEWISRAVAEDIDFGLVVPNEPTIVSGNASLLGELVSNLIDNALRYSGRGSHVTVTVGARPPSIRVEDDGPGIPVAERERIFERFHRLDGTGPQGCGLGLAIVREIAKLHRANVQVMNGRDDVGAQFNVVFQPMAAAST